MRAAAVVLTVFTKIRSENLVTLAAGAIPIVAQVFHFNVYLGFIFVCGGLTSASAAFRAFAVRLLNSSVLTQISA